MVVRVGMVRDKVRGVVAFMENYEFLRKKKEMIRDESLPISRNHNNEI